MDLFIFLIVIDQSGLVFLGLSTETGDCKLCVCVCENTKTNRLYYHFLEGRQAGRQASLPLQCQEAECSIVGTLTPPRRASYLL